MRCCGSENIQDPRKKAINDKLTAIGWALFLIMIGCLLLVPEGKIPGTIWLIGLGVIMLLINGVRYLFGIKIDTFGVILGIIILVIGISGLLGITLPLFPIALIVVGAHIIIKLLIKSFAKK